MAKDAFGAKIRERVNWPVTVALILVALIVVVFPLYMTVRIAVSTSMPTGLEIFTLPEHWDFANFAEAMEETQFFSSFMNSLIITVVAVVVSILVHSLARTPSGATWTAGPLSGAISLSSPACTCPSRSS